jgi:DNA-binding transcriptional ArsR family regulator
MGSSEARLVSDAQSLRAVAHPVRIELMALLRTDGPLTASRCAERLHLTAKLASYHLQILGKYGLIEETGGGKGRERPWRISAGLAYVHQPEPAGRAADAASDQLARTLLARDARIVSEFIAGRHRLPGEWRNVSAMLGDDLRLNPDQLRSLSADLSATVKRYAELSGQQPLGARTVHVAVYAVPSDPSDAEVE